MSWTKGWKAFDTVEGRADAGRCRGFLFEEGKTYEIDGKLELCHNGFHACKDYVLCLEYYPQAEIFAEVEFIGQCDYEQPTEHKGATDKIRIVKFYKKEELDLTGLGNSGNYNSGNGNSGRWNSGNYNSGSWNSGNWNSCNRETGFFNTKEPHTINVFNKPVARDVWESCKKPKFIYFDLDHKLTYKQNWEKAYSTTTQEEIELLKALPNFDADVFFELTGICVE